MKKNAILTIIALAAAWQPHALADEYEVDANLAQQLANPIAALISVPFQFNYQSGIGPTAVALRQQGPWTTGMLANHITRYFLYARETANKGKRS